MVNINIYILDRNLNICNTLSSNGDVNSSPFFNDVYKQVLETGVETFEFESMQLDYLENCNYVAFEYKGDLKLFQISEIEDTHEDNLVKRVYCEMAGIELTYEIIRPRMIQSANIRQFLEILLSDTSWNVGYIDEDITDVFTIEISDFEKIYDVIQENIKLFECEIVFRVEKENGIFKKYIDAYKSRGDITNYRFEYSKNIQGISRTVNSFELVTALIGVGKDDLTFKSCEWSKSNGDPIDKPKGQDYIVDESAFRLYNNNGSHLMGYYKCDLDTPYDLLNATYKELKERNTPKVDYEVDITLIDDEANIGDTVYVIDNDWQPTPLHLSARISQLEISFTDKTKNKCTLSNYNRVKSKIKDDLNEILNRIPEDTSFMGISKGGLLSSSIEVNGYRLQIKNKLTDKNGKEYFFRLKDKTSTSFMNNILTKDPKYVTQSFAIDFDESCIYTTQSITETDPHHILITKMNFTGDILGYMRLHGFGHGSQIGIDKIDGVTKIWCECEGRPHTDTGRLYGTKICRFEFVDGAEYTNSTGSVYDIIPNARNIQVAISEETNRLSVKYITYDNKNGFKVFDLRSVLNNRPRVLASFLIPNWLEDSINPNQGHSVYENRIYHYQGGDSQSAEARITVLDFRGNVLDSNIIKDGIRFTNREPEGLYLRCNNGIYELYAGISEGAWPNRKYHIYKYYEGLGSEYEKRGTFIHNNGHSTDIYETIIDTNLDGTARRKEYLIYSSNKTSQFIIGSFKNGSWWVNNELYTPEVNDAIIAELIESDNAMEIILLTNDFESIKGENGQDGSPGQDAIFLELTNEFHSVPTDADGNGGIYAGCETELRLYKGDVQLTDNISYSIKNTSNITGKLDGDKYTVTNLTKDTGYVDLVATYFGKEYIKRFSVSKNKQGLGGEDGLTPTVYWLMTSTSTISKDSKGNLKPSSVTFWAKSQTGEDSVVNYQGIFKIYESIDGNIFTLKHTSELDDAFPYTPSSTAQSIKCELYLNDGTTLIDQDIVNIVKDGTDGFSGADAKYVLLTGEQIFKYTNNFTGTPTPSSITLTGTPFNISSSNAKWYYKKSSDTNYTLISANNGKMEFTLNHNDSTLFANNNKVVTIKFDIDGYYDEMTIAKISDGSSGSDGEDGYFVLLTNENHTVPCENDGTVVNGELEKAKTEIHVFKGTQEVSFSLSKTDVGCTSTYDSSTKTLSITSLTSKAATVTMQITVNGTVFTKVMTISKATKGDTGEDSYTVDMTNDNYSFNCDAKGNIASVITTTTVITAFKGVNPVVPTIGTLPTVAGLTLSKSNGIITIKANTGTSLADNGSFDIPVTVGGNNFIKTFSWTKVKNGSNGSDGTSPVLVTISGQQSMKYLDKTSAPTPSTITLTANVMEGNVVVSSGITYIWQYKNSSGTWVNLSGTYTSKTYSLAHNNTGFVNEVAQIRVAVSYKSKTYYLEHTVTKIYDNKYISKQEVFDKITEGGTNQLIYKDPSTGEIYINATFIKTGQLVADLIKGGILTLGGTGNSDTGDYGRFRILDSTGQNELASMDGGEMRMVNLQAEELNATNLNVKNINCATYAPAIYEYTKVYVNTTSGNDEVEFESGAVFKTLQGALDSAPKNLNGFTTEIVLQTAVSENIVIRGFSGGTLNILMNSKNINGYVVARDCSAQVFILGGLTTTDIPDSINNTGLRPNIQPSQLFSFGGYNYSFVAIGCPFVYVRSVDIFGKTGTTTNYCGGSVNGSNVYVQNVNAYASNSGWNVTTGGKMTTKETYGRCERLAYNVQLGGVAHICNGNSTGAPSNIYTGNGGQVVQGNVTFVGSGDVGSNDNTTTNSTSVTLNASSGDSYKVKYSSWRKDNSVRQGDWSSTGMNKGCWFFGNQFADLKGKTIKSVKLTLQRQSGGNSGAVTFTLKMHNHTGRPSGVPSYLSEWSKNISLTVGQSTTITITDSAVLTAIKNGTMKGFGIEVSSTSNSYYGILTPKLKAVVTY